jgi:cytochrome c-type protein NapC
MLRNLLNRTTAILLAGLILGVVLTLGAEQMDRFTSTDAFCTSCHAMSQYIVNSETYKASAHRTTNSGVRASCADCHIPKGLVAATWTHAVAGARDLYGVFRYDYNDPKVWEERKSGLANATRLWLRGNDSATCRSCHEEDAIKPQRKRGQRQHEEAPKEGLTCIDCHYNLVHDPIEPTDAFLDSAGNQD